MKKQNDEINIKDLINLFLPKLWIILVCGVILAIILGGYSMFIKRDTYTSKAIIMVSKSNATSITSSDIDLSAKVIDTVEEVIFSRNFLTKICNTINTEHADRGWKLRPSDVSAALSVKLNDNTSIFRLSATTTDRILSKVITDTVSTHIVGESSILGEFLPASYGVIDMTMLEDPREGSLNDKGTLSNALIGFLVGAVVSMVVIYLVAMFDVVIHDRKKLEDHFDYPILGVIPRYEVEVSEEELEEAAE